MSVFNPGSNLNNSVYVSADKNKGKSRSSLNALSFYRSNTSVYVKKVDKSDKKENVKTLIRYLGWKNYTGSVSPNLFKNPSMTDLINIWNFIFKHVDPLIEVNKDNYGEVVLSFYKDIGYPYTISKSTLVAPTTGLQYNTHLSALAWLCQLLIFEVECFNDINEEKEINFSEEIAEDKDIDMDEFILHSYKSYINRDERNLKDLMNAKLDKEISQLEESIRNKSDEISEKKSKIEEIKGHIKENEELIKKNKVLFEENKKIKSLYEDSLDETAKLEKDIEVCKKASQDEKTKTEEMLEEIKKIRDVLQKQTLNKAQFVQMNEDIEANKEKLEKVKEEISMLKNEYPTISEKLHVKHEDLKKLAKSINDQLLEITELLNLYKNVSISEWKKINSFSISIDSFDVDRMLNVNWKDKKREIKMYIEQDEQELKNSLQLIAQYENEVKSLEEEIHTLNEELEKGKQTIMQLNDDSHHFVEKSTKTYEMIVANNQKMIDEAKEKKNEASEMLKEVMASKEEKEGNLNQLKMDNEKIFREKLVQLQEECDHLLEMKNYSRKYVTMGVDMQTCDLEIHNKMQQYAFQNYGNEDDIKENLKEIEKTA